MSAGFVFVCAASGGGGSVLLSMETLVGILMLWDRWFSNKSSRPPPNSILSAIVGVGIVVVFDAGSWSSRHV